MKNNLTPEQSQRLIDLGVDASKASDFEYLDPYGLDDAIPTGVPLFTLSDILSLLPKEIENEDGDPYGLQMDYDEKWEACYFNWVNFTMVGMEGSMHSEFAPELIDALYELLCWVLQNHPDKIKRL